MAWLDAAALQPVLRVPGAPQVPCTPFQPQFSTFKAKLRCLAPWDGLGGAHWGVMGTQGLLSPPPSAPSSVQAALARCCPLSTCSTCGEGSWGPPGGSTHPAPLGLAGPSWRAASSVQQSDGRLEKHSALLWLFFFSYMQLFLKQFSIYFR